MKNIFILFISICLFFNLLNAQTTPISSKSHSANRPSIEVARDGGFGNPSTLFAQTTPISLKSHSESSDNISIAADGGFGNPRRPIPKKVIYLNDSMVIEEKNEWGEKQYLDTIWNHPEFSNPKNTLKKLKKMYPDVTFKGFKERGKICHRPTGKYRKTHLQEKKSAENSPSAAIYWGIMGVVGVCGWAAYKGKKANS